MIVLQITTMFWIRWKFACVIVWICKEKNYFWPSEIHAADPLVVEPIVFEVETATERFKRSKSSVIDQIPTELMKTEGKTICYVFHELITSIWIQKELLKQWKESICVPFWALKLTVPVVYLHDYIKNCFLKVIFVFRRIYRGFRM